MVFDPLYEADQRGELFGAVCRWHLRQDGQITISEIIVSQPLRRSGLARYWIEQLKQVPNALSIFAICPAYLEDAVQFYEAMGFVKEKETYSANGRLLYHFRLRLDNDLLVKHNILT